MTGKLEGRAAIITGASMGFGAAVAEAFIREGAAVYLCARYIGPLRQQADILKVMYPKARIHFESIDVSDESNVEHLVEDAVKKLGPIQIVVNNAGVYGPMGSIDTINLEAWKRAIAINLLGPVYVCHQAVKYFKKTGYGKIINLSGGGATNPLPGLSAYAASKAALVRLTETIALEVKNHDIDSNALIDINSVAPGPLATRMNDQVIEAGPDAVGQLMYERSIALRNNGGTDPAIGANLCVYLASSESDGISGKLIAACWDPWPFDKKMREKLDDYNLYTLRRIT